MLPVALAALAAGTAQAQTIHGVVSDSSSGAAVEGAFVVLIDAEGEAVARGLTGAAGRYRMTAPEVGRYRIRVDRIGYRSSTSARFELPEAGIRVDVQVAGQAVDLGGIQVRGEGRCALRPEEGEPTWRLWDEARKALEATRWTEARRELGFEIVRYERHLDPESLVVRRETGEILRVVSHQAFFADSPESLARDGYIREAGSRRQYYGPDAAVLLSESFLDTHCFRRIEGARPGEVGLAFQPVDADARNEVRGVLWLDGGTSELRSLEFRYVNASLPVHVDPGRYGGRAELQRLRDGSWIVSRWRIRMPVFRGGRWFVSGRRVREFQEIEAEILDVRSADGDPLPFRRSSAVLAGLAVKSDTGQPLDDAEIELDGTPYTVRTNRAGAFRLTGLPSARYRLRLRHPAVRRFEPLTVELVRGDTLYLEIGG